MHDSLDRMAVLSRFAACWETRGLGKARGVLLPGRPLDRKEEVKVPHIVGDTVE